MKKMLLFFLIILGIGTVLKVFFLFFSFQGVPPTVNLQLGNSIKQVENVLGPTDVRQNDSFAYQIDSKGNAHYLLQFSKSGRVVSMRRVLYPSEQDTRTLTKADCTAMAPAGTFIRSYNSGYLGYPGVYTYQSSALKNLGFGAGDFFISLQYQQPVGGQVQIVSCQAGIGKVFNGAA